MRILADENFHNKVLNGLCKKLPELDVLEYKILRCTKSLIPKCWNGLHERIELSSHTMSRP